MKGDGRGGEVEGPSRDLSQGSLPWSTRERRALRAFADAFAPGGGTRDGPAGELPGASALGVDNDAATAVDQLPAGAQAQFHRLLRAVENPLLNLLLGELPYPFSWRSEGSRERYLGRWARSHLTLKRQGFHAMKRLVLFLYYTAELPGGTPLAAAAAGFRPESPAPTPEEAVTPATTLRPLLPERDTTYDADAVVVGSGAGGATIAAYLARAGHSVLVVDAGGYYGGNGFPRGERTAIERMYQMGGFLATEDFAINILAGEVAGGSTTINWMTCLRPPATVRAEWEARGLTGVATSSFDRNLETVEERLHVSADESQLNPSNDALRRGCEALGYRANVDFEVIRRNAVGCRERCGPCVFGCVYGAKQSALATYLPDAARSGARFLFRTRVDRIVVEGGVAKGVVATFRDGGRERTVTVHARVVVAAGGAVQTPPLLLRSGVTGPGIGLGLRLHPTTAVVAEYDRPIRMWEGPMQTIAVRRFQPSDVGLHGPWLEAVPAHPGLAALGYPWQDAASHRESMRRLERSAATIVLVRDHAEGRVGVDPHGAPVIQYRPTRRDADNLVLGMVEAARIHQAAGAVRISSLHLDPVVVGDLQHPVTQPELEVFAELVRRRGIPAHGISLFSAHPVGSARAGRNPETSAATGSGEVHGVSNLFIGDGSYLPTAPGVNPMLSIMALALRTAYTIEGRLRETATGRSPAGVS